MVSALILVLVTIQIVYGYDLTIGHFSNFESTYLPYNEHNLECKKYGGDVCRGGIARLHTTIQRIKFENQHCLVVNVGDNLQGSVYYYMWKWNITQYFLNKLSIDVMTVGNHDFDDGTEILKEFLNHTTIPVVLTNLYVNNEAYKSNLLKRHHIVEMGGKKIGIVAVLFEDASEITHTDNWILTDEIEAVNDEVDEILDKGAFTVIVLSHCTYEFNLELANATRSEVSVIIGGHKNTVLFTGMAPFGERVGGYPTSITRKDDSQVLVVHTMGKTAYLGALSVYYNKFGRVQSYSGNPIPLDMPIPEGNLMETLLQPFTDEIDIITHHEIGESLVHIDAEKCLVSECYIGNLITDAFVDRYITLEDTEYWAYAAIAIINAGQLKQSIQYGPITYKEMFGSLPFMDVVCVGELKGSVLANLFEHMSNPFKLKHPTNMNMLQVSGIRVLIDKRKPAGQRVTSMEVRCNKCSGPYYYPLNRTEYYRVIMPNFLMDGKDGFHIIPENAKNIECGDYDIDLFSAYIEDNTPISVGLQNRILFVE